MDLVKMVRRYEPYVNDLHGVYTVRFDLESDGEWVLYSDYEALSAELETVKGERDEAILSGWKAAIDCVSYTAANTYGPRVDAKAVSAARDELVQELLTSSPGEYLDVQWKNAQDAVAAEAKLAGGEVTEAMVEAYMKAADNSISEGILRSEMTPRAEYVRAGLEAALRGGVS